MVILVTSGFAVHVGAKEQTLQAIPLIRKANLGFFSLQKDYTKCFRGEQSSRPAKTLRKLEDWQSADLGDSGCAALQNDTDGKDNHSPCKEE